jgi:type VI secretion system secreted protein Hcp
MAIPGYMSLTDDAGNSIKGSVIVKDRENQIEVLGLYHNVSYNSDLHNGRALSKRQHRPFLIEKEIDASSVFSIKHLALAVRSGKRLSTCTESMMPVRKKSISR